MQAHQLVEEGKPIHVGHLDVERDHVRIERLDLFAGRDRILGRTDHHDVVVAPQRARQNLANERRVIDDENLDGHAASFARSLRDW